MDHLQRHTILERIIEVVDEVREEEQAGFLSNERALILAEQGFAKIKDILQEEGLVA